MQEKIRWWEEKMSEEIIALNSNDYLQAIKSIPYSNRTTCQLHANKGISAVFDKDLPEKIYVLSSFSMPKKEHETWLRIIC